MNQDKGFTLNRFKKHFLLNSRMGVNFEQLMARDTVEHEGPSVGSQKHQLLRSASMWSLGLGEGQNEHSIMNAYIALIR
jgi:hypothetical protein